MRIVVVCRLSDEKLLSKIRPLMVSPLVQEIHIVRREPLSGDKIKSWQPPALWARTGLTTELYRLGFLLYFCWRHRPDLLIGYYLVPHGVYVGLASWLFGIPGIQMIIGKDLDLALGSRWLLWLLRRADFVGLRGENMRRALIAHGLAVERLFIPPNVFDFSTFLPQQRPVEYDLIYVGNLSRYKRVDILIEVVARLKPRFPDLRLALIGSGKLARALQVRVARAGLSENVVFLGHKSKSEVRDHLNRSRVFIMTSEAEGLPMAVVEAMSCGLPVIVPDVGDVTDVAHDGINALVVPVLDVDAFVCAVTQLLTDTALYRRLAGQAVRIREVLADRYSLAHAERIWSSVLERVQVGD
jgi:glycosyltransferase involved in cell wall biosynthesis